MPAQDHDRGGRQLKSHGIMRFDGRSLRWSVRVSPAPISARMPLILCLRPPDYIHSRWGINRTGARCERTRSSAGAAGDYDVLCSDPVAATPAIGLLSGSSMPVTHGAERAEAPERPPSRASSRAIS